MSTRGRFRAPNEETAPPEPSLDDWSCRITPGMAALPDLLPEFDTLSPPQRRASLLHTIEAEILPRLMLAHMRPPEGDARNAARAVVTPQQVAELTTLSLGTDAGAVARYVRERLHAGLPIDRLYLDLLADAARRLGAMWEADLCDFTQVTVGLWRLQQVVHEHSPAFQREGDRPVNPRTAMLVAAPGSQHTFGVVVVGEFFRRAGWDVWGDPCATLEDMVTTLHGQWFDLVGLSVGAECHVPQVASAILALREASLNPSMVVMVGGPVVSLLADFVVRVGADATAADAATAVAQAERLCMPRCAPA